MTDNTRLILLFIACAARMITLAIFGDKPGAMSIGVFMDTRLAELPPSTEPADPPSESE